MYWFSRILIPKLWEVPPYHFAPPQKSCSNNFRSWESLLLWENMTRLIWIAMLRAPPLCLIFQHISFPSLAYFHRKRRDDEHLMYMIFVLNTHFYSLKNTKSYVIIYKNIFMCISSILYMTFEPKLTLETKIKGE